jgi:hypothetical protein
VDLEESQDEEYRARGIKTPGWVSYVTYTDANGNLRNRVVPLVVMKVAREISGNRGNILALAAGGLPDTPPSFVQTFSIENADFSTVIFGTSNIDFSEEGRSRSIKFSADGLRAHVVGESNLFTQFVLTIPYDLTTRAAGTYVPIFETAEAAAEIYVNFAFDMEWHSGGAGFYVICQNTGITSYTVATPYDLMSAITYVGQSLVPFNAANFSYSIQVTEDGTKMFIAATPGGSDYRIYEYSMSTPFDISTIAAVRSVTGASLSITFLTDIHITRDGLTAFLVDYNNGTRPSGFAAVTEYSMSAPFDITTLTFVRERGVADAPELWDVEFSADGTTMFIVSGDNGVYTVQNPQ